MSASNVFLRKKKCFITTVINSVFVFLLTIWFITVQNGSSLNSFEAMPLFRKNQVVTVPDIIVAKSDLDLKPGDIYNLRTPLKFQPGYKNPCFKVKLESRCPGTFEGKKRTPVDCYNPSRSNETELACLPYFFLIGFTKCGTSDLCQWMTIHQDIVKASRKELHYWDNLRQTPLLSNYIFSGFARITKEVNGWANKRQNGEEEDYSKITGECTPRTAWAAGERHGFNGAGGPPSINVSDTHQLTPYRIAHILPNLKIIVIMRNPIHRLWSHFFFSVKHPGPNYAQYFHNRISTGIDWIKNCTIHRGYPLKVCVYGSNYYHTYGLPNLRDSWSKDGVIKMRIGLYHVVLEDWLKSFPRENFQFVLFEDYVKDPQSYVSKHILPHLGLKPYNDSIMKKAQTKRAMVVNKNWAKPPITHMWQKTMSLLKEFYKPYNVRLAELLNDEKYLLWNQ